MLSSPAESWVHHLLLSAANEATTMYFKFQSNKQAEKNEHIAFVCQSEIDLIPVYLIILYYTGWIKVGEGCGSVSEEKRH